MKIAKNVQSVLAGVTVMSALVLLGCAGAPKARSGDGDLYPPKIQSWYDENQDGNVIGVGIADIDGDESFASREAATIALGELARNLETHVAGISTNLQAKLQQKGETPARVGKAIESTKQVTDQTISRSKTVGPVKQDGKIYVLKYIDENSIDTAAEKAAAESLEITEAELDKILGL